MVGQTISHYKILEKLGEGGMGVVYKAQDTKLDRFVALKFLPPHLNASEQDKARFVQEAKSAAALNHPNVCSVIDIQEHDNQMFIVMEFIDGETLRIKEQSGVLSQKSAIDFGIQIAEGLAAAHEKGIVHRDIKPENIMIRKDNIAQIMDFGLAKLQLSKTSRLTRQGSTVGTAGYMSPEQVQGREADHRSDIFSLGVLLYELFTGRLPFQGAHETALMYEIVNVDPPPLSVVRPDLDPEFDRIVLECIQKEPDERYNSVKDIAKDLKRLKRESSRQNISRTTGTYNIRDTLRPSGNGTSAKSGSSRLFLYAFSAVSVLLVAAVAWYWFTQRQFHQADVVKFTLADPGVEFGSFAAVSPDGKQIAFIGSSVSGDHVYVRSLSDLESRPLSGTEGAGTIATNSGCVCYSPDGEWIAFAVEGKLKKIPVRGGSATTICTETGLRGAAWGDDNTIVYTPATNTGLSRISSNGGDAVTVSTLDSAAGEISHRYPDVLPGSKAVLFTVKTNSITKFSDAKIAVKRLDAKEKKILIEGGSFARYITTGHILYGQGGSIYAVPFDPDRLELTGTPVKVLDGGMFVESYGSMLMGVSRSGTIVYAPGGPWPQDSNMIYEYDRKGNRHQLVETPGGYASVSVSPDRGRVAYFRLAANDDIWIYDLRRHLSTRFTFAGGNNWYPLWSPDGKHIVYTAERGGPPNLFRKPVDGTGQEERLASGSTVQIADGWSPGGKFLAFHQANDKGNADIWILPMEGDRKPRRFIGTKFDETFASFSPDGRWLAYTSNESGQWEVYVTAFPSGEGKWQVSTGGGMFPKWTKVGSEIIYLDQINENIVSVPITYSPELHPGKGNVLFQLSSQPEFVPDVSPDGEHIAIAHRGKQARIMKLIVAVNWFEELKKQLAAR